jgi:hypothetical protein
MPKLGETVDVTKARKGVPPIVIAIQPSGFFVLEKPEDLKHWEEVVGRAHGTKAPVGMASESCSGGCSDDCDQ